MHAIRRLLRSSAGAISISRAGLVDSGQRLRPGETRTRSGAGVSLAHRGVLFQAELQVQPTRCRSSASFGGLEVLRQPLEDRTETISRARGSLTFPANFMLVGFQNPCPCS